MQRCSTIGHFPVHQALVPTPSVDVFDGGQVNIEQGKGQIYAKVLGVVWVGTYAHLGAGGIWGKRRGVRLVLPPGRRPFLFWRGIGHFNWWHPVYFLDFLPVLGGVRHRPYLVFGVPLASGDAFDGCPTFDTRHLYFVVDAVAGKICVGGLLGMPGLFGLRWRFVCRQCGGVLKGPSGCGIGCGRYLGCLGQAHPSAVVGRVGQRPLFPLWVPLFARFHFHERYQVVLLWPYVQEYPVAKNSDIFHVFILFMGQS